MSSLMDLGENLEEVPVPKNVSIRLGDGVFRHDIKCHKVIIRDGALTPKSVLTFHVYLDAIPGIDLMNTYVQEMTWNGEALRVGRVYRMPERGMIKIVTLRSSICDNY